MFMSYLCLFLHIFYPSSNCLYSVTISSVGRKNAACLSPNFQQFEEIDISRSRV